MTEQETTLRLKTIRDEIFAGTHLPLYSERVKNNVYPVIGEGNHQAKIMFIGEAPGRTESLTGRPFCGAAGKVLDTLLDSIGLPRAEVYITNILKDRPPQNRDPFPSEIASYAPYLLRQLEAIQPSIIATLGRHSMSFLMDFLNIQNTERTISKLHGQLFNVTANYAQVNFIPFYHPAVAVYNRETYATLANDFKSITKLISQTVIP